jgi:hypothetical protein
MGHAGACGVDLVHVTDQMPALLYRFEEYWKGLVERPSSPPRVFFRIHRPCFHAFEAMLQARLSLIDRSVVDPGVTHVPNLAKA